MTYFVLQYPGVYPRIKHDVVAFAEQQAELYKDKYKAILFLKTESELDKGENYQAKLQYKLLYREKLENYKLLRDKDEYADIYLLAENGQLVPDDEALITEEGVGTQNMPGVNEKTALAKNFMYLMIFASISAWACAVKIFPPGSR